MKGLALLVLCLGLLAGLASWWYSPGQVVKRRTHTLLETLTLEAGSGTAVRQMGVYSLGALLADDVELETPSIQEAQGTFPRSEMESAFSSLCEHAKQTRFQLENIRSLKIDGDHADLTANLHALVELPTYRPVDGRFEVVFHWQRDKDRTWQLARASIKELK